MFCAILFYSKEFLTAALIYTVQISLNEDRKEVTFLVSVLV